MKNNRLKQLTIFTPASGTPGDEAVSHLLRCVLIALAPAVIMSTIFFGVGSLKVTLTAVAASLFFEFLAQKYLLKKPVTLRDGAAAVAGILLAFCLPAGLPVWQVALGALLVVGFSHFSFGLPGKNPFHPVLAGWLALRLAFPAQMTTWKAVITAPDTFTGATPLGLVKQGVETGKTLNPLTADVQFPAYFDLFWGNVSGSLGEISAIAILMGGLYLIWKKVITWHIPATVLGTMLLIETVLWMAAPGRFMDPVFHLITGGAILGSFFYASDLFTSPATPAGKLIAGAAIGLLTLVIRNFSPLPEGIALAILIVNGFTPLIDAKTLREP